MRQAFRGGNPHHAGGPAQTAAQLLVTRDDPDIGNRAPANGQSRLAPLAPLAGKAFQPGIGRDIGALARAADHGRRGGIQHEEIQRLVFRRGFEVERAINFRLEHGAQALGVRPLIMPSSSSTAAWTRPRSGP